MNMDIVYNELGDYNVALGYYEKCGAIYEQILPLIHINWAELYMHIGTTYDNLADYNTALSYYNRPLS